MFRKFWVLPPWWRGTTGEKHELFCLSTVLSPNPQNSSTNPLTCIQVIPGASLVTDLDSQEPFLPGAVLQSLRSAPFYPALPPLLLSSLLLVSLGT